MARRDTLAVLARVRDAELLTARREFAHLAAVAARTEAARCAAEAMRASVRATASPADYAAWRPAAEATRLRLEAQARHDASRAEAALQAMVGAWVSASVVDRFQELTRKAERSARLAQDQARLEEAACRQAPHRL